MFSFSCEIFFIITIISCGSTTKLYYKLYKNFDNIAICTKLLNDTTTVGCDGSIFPQMGILVDNLSDRQIDYIHQHKVNYRLVPIYRTSHSRSFKEFLEKLNNISNSIAGVLMLRPKGSQLEVGVLSDDVACPIERILNHSQYHRWINAPDQQIGLFFSHWKFPIFFIDDDANIDHINQCVDKWNNKLFGNNQASIKFNLKIFASYCAVELYSPSYAPNVKFDSQMCLKRKDRFFTMDETSYCHNIFPQNILTPVVPMLSKNGYAERSWLILAVRLDSLSLYSGKSPGADSVYSSLITLLAIVHTLSLHQEQLKVSQKQILFAFYGGESLDIIGSSYHAFNLFNSTVSQNNTCERDHSPWSCSGMDKINLKNIGHFVELNQLASYGTNSSIWLHANQANSSQESFLQLLLTSNVSDLSVHVANPDLPMPPSSVYSFLQLDANIEAIVGCNYHTHFANPYYHSTFDDFHNFFSQYGNWSLEERIQMETQHLARISTLVSRAAARFLVNTFSTNSILPDSQFIDTLVNCIFIDSNCSLLRMVRSNDPDFYNQSKFNDTHVMSTENVLTELVYDLMTYWTGENVTCPNITNEETFEDEAYFYNKHDGYCTRHQVFRENAISPHFLGAKTTSTRFSQWVSSYHPPVLLVPPLRLFLFQSKYYGWLTCLVGLVITLLATFATILLTNAF